MECRDSVNLRCPVIGELGASQQARFLNWSHPQARTAWVAPGSVHIGGQKSDRFDKPSTGVERGFIALFAKHAEFVVLVVNLRMAAHLANPVPHLWNPSVGSCHETSTHDSLTCPNPTASHDLSSRSVLTDRQRRIAIQLQTVSKGIPSVSGRRDLQPN